MKNNYIQFGHMKIHRTRLALGILGKAAGLVYAYASGKGFWGYVGFYLLGGMIGGGIGYLLTPNGPEEQKQDKA